MITTVTSKTSLLNVDVTNPVVREHYLNKGMVGWWLTLPQYASTQRLVDLGGKWHGTIINPIGSDPVAIPIVPTSRSGGYGAQNYLLDPALSKKIALPDFSGQFAAGEATFAGWFKRWESIPTGPNAGNRAGWCGLALPANTSLNTLYTWTDGNSYIGIFDNGRPITYSIPNRTQWNHVVVVSRSGSNNYKLYVNGTQRAQATRGTFSIPSAPMFGGHTIVGPNQYFDGRADDWRLWSRGFSAAEVATLYRESVSGYPNMLRRTPLYIPFSASDLTHPNRIGGVGYPGNYAF